ncbi:hypothetical protein D3C85_1453380 [compost metagenome]
MGQRVDGLKFANRHHTIAEYQQISLNLRLIDYTVDGPYNVIRRGGSDNKLGYYGRPPKKRGNLVIETLCRLYTKQSRLVEVSWRCW